MISIIVFSKGRPMQLHAYLESLVHFSDAQEEQITILYCETEGIRYDRVMKAFPKVHWMIEKKFESNLKEAVSNAGEYIMFDCDDVVFTHTFSLQKAQAYLQSHEQVFGFSLRLEANITPRPTKLSSNDKIIEWDRNCAEQHYNCPWELNCTLYRKADIEKLIEENPIKNPNFFEAMVTQEQRQKPIYKRKMKEFKHKLAKFPKRVYRHFESKKYLTGGYEHKLTILNTEETLSLLEKEQFSFLRYGDGEIAIMQGKSIPFQEYNSELAQKLKNILKTKEKGIKVGIPYYYMHPVASLNEFTKKFARALPAQRKFLCRNCNKDTIYIDTALTQVYQTYQEYNFAKYYERMQNLLKNKDVTVVCGEGVLDRLEYKALDVCHSVEYVYAPSMNAYSQYDTILKMVLGKDKNRLVCVVLGPAAKALVYDLAKAGYQAWDMGHYFKDYDAFLKKRPRTGEEIAKFYQPD